jgi:hypothetical protein
MQETFIQNATKLQALPHFKYYLSSETSNGQKLTGMSHRQQPVELQLELPHVVKAACNYFGFIDWIKYLGSATTNSRWYLWSTPFLFYFNQKLECAFYKLML